MWFCFAAICVMSEGSWFHVNSSEKHSQSAARSDMVKRLYKTKPEQQKAVFFLRRPI